MNIFKKIGLALKARKILNQATREVKTMDGVKPGWQTTEFWGKTVVQMIVLYNTFFENKLDPQVGAQIVGAIEGLYHALRAVIKIGKDIAAAFKKKEAAPAV
jgi:hypothetical protein